MADTISLYDFARRGDINTCWSYNVWKARLVLNYKRIPYCTVWVDSNTIGPTLKSIGVAPGIADPAFEYTVPSIKVPDGSVITDSAMIARRLAELYPSPSLNLDSDLESKAQKVVQMAAVPLFAIYMPLLARDVVCESSVSVFKAIREKKFGMTFEELEKKGGASGEQAWLRAEPGFAAWKALLADHKKDEGSFILGSEVSYADFMLVALLEAFKCADVGLFERVVGWDECFVKSYNASREWLKNNR